MYHDDFLYNFDSLGSYGLVDSPLNETGQLFLDDLLRLEQGTLVEFCHRYYDGSLSVQLFSMLRIVINEDNGNAKCFILQDGRETEASLADRGAIPYIGTRLWNRSNWLRLPRYVRRTRVAVMPQLDWRKVGF